MNIGGHLNHGIWIQIIFRWMLSCGFESMHAKSLYKYLFYINLIFINNLYSLIIINITNFCSFFWLIVYFIACLTFLPKFENYQNLIYLKKRRK